MTEQSEDDTERFGGPCEELRDSILEAHGLFEEDDDDD